MLRDHIVNLRQVYGQRMDAVSNALRSKLADELTFTEPGGRYFFWLNLSGGIDADTLLQQARIAGVSYRPGTAFSASGGFRKSLRISIALYESDELLERLGGWEMPLTGTLAKARSGVGLRRKVWIHSSGYNHHHAGEYDCFAPEVLTTTGGAGIFMEI